MSSGTFILSEFMRLAKEKHILELLRRLCGRKSDFSGRAAEVWERLDEPLRARAEGVFRQIHDFACREGFDALRAARLELPPGALTPERELSWEIIARSRRSFRDKAFAARLYFPEIFQRAAVYLALFTRPWSRADLALPAGEPDLSEAALSALEQRLSDFYLREQGRGRVCTAALARARDLIYICARPDDYAAEYLAHDRQKRLRRRLARGTFQLIFAIDPRRKRGYLDAPGGAREEQCLRRIFFEVLYHAQPRDNPARCRLGRLLDDDFFLQTAAPLRVEARAVRLDFPGAVRLELTSWPPADYRAALAELRRSAYSLRRAAAITRVELRLMFLAPDGSVRRREQLTLTPDRRPSLLGLEAADRRIVEEYFLEKGIYDDRPEHSGDNSRDGGGQKRNDTASPGDWAASDTAGGDRGEFGACPPGLGSPGVARLPAAAAAAVPHRL